MKILDLQLEKKHKKVLTKVRKLLKYPNENVHEHLAKALKKVKSS